MLENTSARTAALTGALSLVGFLWVGVDAVLPVAVLILSFFLIFFYPRAAERGDVVTAYVLSILVHHLVAAFNAQVVTLKGAGSDALTFHATASALAADGRFGFGIDSVFYENLIAVFYWLSAPSPWGASMLTVLVLAVASIYFLRLVDILGFSRFALPAFVLFSFWPSALLYTSVPLRDGWELMLVLAITYHLFVFVFERRATALLLAVLAGAGLALVHKAGVIIAGLLVAVAIVWPGGERRRGACQRAAAAFAALTLVAGLLALIAGLGGQQGSRVVQRVLDGNPFEVIENHRQSTRVGRTTYDAGFTAPGPLGVVSGTGAMLVHYMFQPFPWRIDSALDMYAFAESAARGLLLLGTFMAYRRADRRMRRRILFLVVVYGLVSLMWAVGTTNYGTAMRHHIVAFWAILIPGLVGLTDTARRLLGFGRHTVRRSGLGEVGG